MQHGYKTAKDVFSGRLYHYENFCPEWLEAILRTRKIHCSDPAKLNDPWDCRVSFDYTAMLIDPAEREKMFAVHRKSLPPEMLNHPLRPVYEDLMRNNDTELVKAVELSSLFLTEQLQQRRIYCLTPHPLSTLMWSHYGGDHTGICLEFHIGNPLFLTAHGVKYLDQYPKFVLTRMEPSDAMDFILTKAKCWEYEEEYRLIGSPHHPDGVPLKLDGEFLRLPHDALLSVIVGCNGDYAAVQEIVLTHAPQVRAIQIARAPNQYRVG